MSTIDKHSPGSFCWFELATTDPAAALAFYRGLFPYEVAESPLPDGSTYAILKLSGRDALAVYRMRPQDHPPGTPPHWMTYLAVKSADETAAAVTGAGGKVLAPPFEVMTHGRMCVCVDPLGAVFCAWQAKEHSGVKVTHEPGAFAWAQLNAPATATGKAQAFYTKAFDWSFREDPMGMGMQYTTWISDDGPRGGMMPMPPGMDAPAHWVLYLAAPDVDGTVAKAKTLGGQVMVPPTEIPGTGRFAVLQDPQGAFFAVVNFTAPMV